MGGASFVGNVDRYEVGGEGGHCGSSFWEWRWGKRRREAAPTTDVRRVVTYGRVTSTVPTRGLHESPGPKPHPLLTPWVLAYQLSLAFDPPEELIKVKQVATFNQPRELVKAQ